MKLLDNFNGQQASHSSRRAVAYHSIGFRNGNAQLEMLRLAEWNGRSQVGPHWARALAT